MVTCREPIKVPKNHKQKIQISYVAR